MTGSIFILGNKGLKPHPNELRSFLCKELQRRGAWNSRKKIVYSILPFTLFVSWFNPVNAENDKNVNLLVQKIK